MKRCSIIVKGKGFFLRFQLSPFGHKAHKCLRCPQYCGWLLGEMRLSDKMKNGAV